MRRRFSFRRWKKRKPNRDSMRVKNSPISATVFIICTAILNVVYGDTFPPAVYPSYPPNSLLNLIPMPYKSMVDLFNLYGKGFKAFSADRVSVHVEDTSAMTTDDVLTMVVNKFLIPKDPALDIFPGKFILKTRS
jgi:hypothetical protein